MNDELEKIEEDLKKKSPKEKRDKQKESGRSVFEIKKIIEKKKEDSSSSPTLE